VLTPNFTRLAVPGELTRTIDGGLLVTVKLLVLELKVITPAETVPLKDYCEWHSQCVIKTGPDRRRETQPLAVAGVYPIGRNFPVFHTPVFSRAPF